MGLGIETTSSSQSQWDLMREFVESEGRAAAVVDGGLATELERHGADLNDPLWSAKCLLSSPHLIRQVPSLSLSPYIYVYVLASVFVFVFVLISICVECNVIQQRRITYSNWKIVNFLLNLVGENIGEYNAIGNLGFLDIY